MRPARAVFGAARDRTQDGDMVLEKLQVVRFDRLPDALREGIRLRQDRPSLLDDPELARGWSRRELSAKLVGVPLELGVVAVLDAEHIALLEQRRTQRLQAVLGEGEGLEAPGGVLEGEGQRRPRRGGV